MTAIATIDSLVEILAEQQDEPLEVILVDETLQHAVSLFGRVIHRLRVRQRWTTNGSRRAELDNGNIIRITSAASRHALRGRSADLVVLTSGALAIGNTLDAARIVVAPSARGRVFVL